MPAPPSDRLPWVIRFRWLSDDEAVLCEFENVELQTAKDALRWAKEVDLRLATFGKKVDLLINLDGLRVKPAASREFGRQRAEVLARHSNRSFRFGGDRSTLTSVHTSSVLEHAAANVYNSFEEARDALRRDKGGVPSSRRSPTSAPAPMSPRVPPSTRR